MGIINCKACGKLCAEMPSKLCGACQKEYFDAEMKVAEYLRSHENSTLDEVHEATKVEKHIILKMIQEGRIIEGNLSYSCERCGKAISSGRYCKYCEVEVVDALNSTEEVKEEPEGRKGMFISEFIKASKGKL